MSASAAAKSVLVDVCFSEREREREREKGKKREREGERGGEREKEWKCIRNNAAKLIEFLERQSPGMFIILSRSKVDC